MGRVYEIPRVWLAQVRSSSTFHESLVWSGLVQSDRVGSGRVGSGRVGSGRVGSGRVGSGRVGSGSRVGSRFHSRETANRARGYVPRLETYSGPP